MSELSFYARHSGATQRARLLAAVTSVVAEQGFHGATVSGVVAAAGVSRSTFYERFDGKFDCIAQAYEEATDIMVQEVSEAAFAAIETSWHAAIVAGATAYFGAVRAEEATARMVFVEFRTAGREAIEVQRRSQARWREQIELLQATTAASGAPTPHLSGPAIALILAGVETRIAHALVSAHDAELVEIEQGLVELLTQPSGVVPGQR